MQGIHVLISSSGRRVRLLECFRESIARSGQKGSIVTVDCASSAPTALFSDAAHLVPGCRDPRFIESVLDICKEESISLIVPTIDTELPMYAQVLNLFSSNAVTVCVSKPAVIEISANKSETNRWLMANGFPVVRQTDIETALLHPEQWPFPLIAKPICGSASINVRKVHSVNELVVLLPEAASYIVEEIATGREFTINVYVNRFGECVCAVPHWRMEVRAGEVSKGITVKDRKLMKVASSIAESLPGAYGPLNIQCFMNDAGEIRIFEINARFGGGYPLAHEAGARFTDWLIDEIQGNAVPPFDRWTDDLAMLRYDAAVFTAGDEIRNASRHLCRF